MRVSGLCLRNIKLYTFSPEPSTRNIGPFRVGVQFIAAAMTAALLKASMEVQRVLQRLTAVGRNCHVITVTIAGVLA